MTDPMGEVVLPFRLDFAPAEADAADAKEKAREIGAEVGTEIATGATETSATAWRKLAQDLGRELNRDTGPAGAMRRTNEETGKAKKSLGEYLMTWRKEETGQARMSRFLAGEIAGFGLLQTGVARYVGQIAAAAAGGAGIGLVIEGVKIAFEVATSRTREAEAAAKAYREEMEKARDASAQAARSFDDALSAAVKYPRVADLTLQFLAPYQKQQEDLLEEKRKLDSEFNKALLADETDKVAELVTSKERWKGRWAQFAEDVKAAAQTAAQQAEAVLAGESSADATRAYYALLTNARVAFDARMKEARKEALLAQVADERERIRVQAALRIEELRALPIGIDDENSPEFKQRAAKRAAAVAEVARQRDAAIQKLDFESARKQEENRRFWLDQGDQAEQDAASARLDRDREVAYLRLAGWDRDGAARLAQIDQQMAAELAAYAQFREDGSISEEEYQARLLRIQERYGQQRIDAARRESYAVRELRDFGANAGRQALNILGGAMERQLLTSRRYEAALRAVGGAEKESAQERRNAVYAELQAVLAGLAKEAAVRALWEGAQAIASLAVYNFDAAAKHGAAAAAFAGVAAVAGAGAGAIGNNRGMTAQERQSVASAAESRANSTSSSARDAGNAATAERTTREVVIVIGDPFETPQETARRAARRLGMAQQLNMLTTGS